ncbi:MAG TPA: hypothetical protein PKK43_10565 [Spirochaetota bacterium]|nr:hypothetical protein [Spirochaetota bacterium]
MVILSAMAKCTSNGRAGVLWSSERLVLHLYFGDICRFSVSAFVANGELARFMR